MNQLVMGLVLIMVTSLGMAFGVVSGYLIIAGILNAFARKPLEAEGTPVLATQGVSGD